MLRAAKEILKEQVYGEKASFGTIHDFVFDGKTQRIHYIVVEPGEDQSDGLWIPVQSIKRSIVSSQYYTVDASLHNENSEVGVQDNLSSSDDHEPLYTKRDENDISTHFRFSRLKGSDIFFHGKSIGHLDDVVCDDHGWFLRYVVMRSPDDHLQKRTVISVIWIESISGHGIILSDKFARSSLAERAGVRLKKEAISHSNTENF